MAEGKETSTKRGKKGNTLPPAPKPFTSQQQPTPEQKSDGWKKKRAERLLTQAILNFMMQGDNLENYTKSLYKNAVKGNAKAIETLNKGVEDDIIKIASTDSEGNYIKPVTFVLDDRYRNTNTDKDDAGLSP